MADNYVKLTKIEDVFLHLKIYFALVLKAAKFCIAHRDLIKGIFANKKRFSNEVKKGRARAKNEELLAKSYEMG